MGHDGKTAYERLKGKHARTLGIEFGEAVLWRMRPAGGALGRLSSLWEEGIFLGVRAKSGEIIVGSKTGVWKTRTIQRRPYEDRWNTSTTELVRGVPWRTCEDDPNVDGEKLEATKLTPQEVSSEREVVHDAIPRRFRIEQQHIDAHGYSAKCDGCRSILRRTTRQTHSEACRKRFSELLKDDEKVKKAEEKGKNFIAKAIEKDDQERHRKRELATNEAEAKDADAGMQVDKCETLIDVGLPTEDRKRLQEDADAYVEKRRKFDEQRGTKRDREDAEHSRGEADVDAISKVFVESVEILQVHGDVLAVHEEPEDDCDYAVEAFDERTGEPLGAKLVMKARAEEVNFMKAIPLFEEVQIEECFEETGKPPVDTKWVELDKGTPQVPEVRCRMVARDFKPRGEKHRGDLFAAMPPLESKKFLFRKAAAQKRVWRDGCWRKMKLMFIDVKKAHLNGVVEPHEKVYVSPPEGCCRPGMCWRLRRWLYGMRPAASAWERDYTEKLIGIGFKAGKSAPTVFFHPDKGVRCVVHGDDFTFLGFEEDLDDVAKEMASWYELKVRGVLGGEPGDLEEITILNQRLTWTGNVMTYEADRKHGQIICEAMGLDRNSNGLTKSIVRETLEDIENVEDNEELEAVGGEDISWGGRACQLLGARPG